jgi:hypothetical protein
LLNGNDKNNLRTRDRLEDQPLILTAAFWSQRSVIREGLQESMLERTESGFEGAKK